MKNRILIKVKGLLARRKLRKAEVLPSNSRKLYMAMKRAGLK